MKLLDLPPELLQEVLSHTVLLVDLGRAFRLRLVNKIFDHEIVRAIHRTRTIKIYPIHIVKPCSSFEACSYSSSLYISPIANYLEAATLADPSGTNHLVSTIRRSSDFLVVGNDADTPYNWHDCVHDLSKLAVTCLGRRLVVDCLASESRVTLIQDDPAKDTLTAAAYTGKLTKVKKLIETGGDVNGKGKVLGRPLQAAASGGHLEIVELLIEHGASVQFGKPRYYPVYLDYVLKVHDLGTALQTASKAGHESIVRLLLEPKNRVNVLQGDYQVAISDSTQEGHQSIVSILLEHIEVVSRPAVYDMVLLRASHFGHISIVRWILNLGVSVSVDPRGSSGTLQHSINLASGRGYYDVVKLLLAEGAEQGPEQAGTSHHLNPLHRAATGGFKQVAQLLVDNGADVDAGPPSTPIVWAARHGQEHMVDFLLQNGAALGKKGCGISAVLYAVVGGYETMLRALARHGADINGDTPEDSPILIATARGQKRIVEVLIELGATRFDLMTSESVQDLTDGIIAQRGWGFRV